MYAGGTARGGHPSSKSSAVAAQDDSLPKNILIRSDTLVVYIIIYTYARIILVSVYHIVVRIICIILLSYIIV